MQTPQRHTADAIYGIQNTHVLKGIAAVERCVERLARDGFVVHSVEVRYSQPVVWIAPDARATALNGVAHTTRTRLGTSITVMTATLEDCQVQWVGN